MTARVLRTEDYDVVLRVRDPDRPRIETREITVGPFHGLVRAELALVAAVSRPDVLAAWIAERKR